MWENAGTTPLHNFEWKAILNTIFLTRSTVHYDWLHSLHAHMEQCLLNKHSIKPACDRYGGEDGVLVGNMTKRDHLEDPGIMQY
jgi:hypothetical protein